MIDTYQLKENLVNGVVTVVFEKTDGTLREMRCTLSPEYLPQLLTEEGSTRSRTMSNNVIAVWDIENGGWRSFRIDSIKQIIVG